MEESPSYRLHKLVAALDRAADRLLRAHMGISYKRALFMSILRDRGTVTQHELAQALGYSDPAVSAMLLELVKEGYVRTEPSPEHGRKRLVTITPEGAELVTQGRQLLDASFEVLVQAADVDIRYYSELTERLYQAIVTGKEKKQP